MLGVGLNIKPRVVNGVDPVAQALITAGNYTNSGVKADIDWFIKSLKSNSLYNSDLKVMHLFITDSDTSATQLSQFKWNALNPLDTNAAFRLTPFNTPTTNKLGTSGNGTTQYWESYFNFNTVMSANVNNMGIMHNYLDSVNAGVCGVLDTTTGGGNRIVQSLMNFGGNTNGCINSNTGTSTASASASGFVAVNRVGTLQSVYYRGALQNSTTTPTTGTPASHSENILRRNHASPLYGSGGVNFRAIFSNYDETKVLLLMSLANELQGRLETSLNLTPNTRKKY